MLRHKWFMAGMLAAALAVALVLPAAASAAYTNADCASCHSTNIGAVPAQKFGVGAVNFGTACKKCHDNSLAGSHPYHNPTSNCGASCHRGGGWGASLGSAVPNYLDSRGYGAFASPTSADVDPALLHIIHSKPRWMESKEFSFSKCGSCHAVATCDSCHDNPPAPDPATHASHASSPTLTPWMGNTSSGVTAGNQTENTYVLNNVSRCGAAACHDTAGVANSAPGLLDDNSHIADAASGYLANTVAKVGTWVVRYSNSYTLGQISQSNATNATLSVQFTGEQFVLVTDKDPYRGIVEVFVDNISQGTVDLYNGTTRNQVEVFKSASLPYGLHTIKVRVTGTKTAAARAAFVSIDQFKVYSNTPGLVAPACTSCHPANANVHGMGNFSHEATGSAAGLLSGKRCDSCHSMPMTVEHSRLSSSSRATGCNACHTTYAPKAMTAAWNTTCAYGTCHIATTTGVPHNAMAAAHTPTNDAAEASCRGCHSGNLDVIHNNSITTNVAVSTCNSCHTPTKFPATKSCVDASCHGVSVNGVTTVDGHSFNIPKHTAAPWTSAYQSVTPTVSTGGKECSSCHSALVTAAHTGVTGGTVSCTTGGTGNTGCHNNTTLNGRAVASSNWTTKKCSECHNYAANSSHDSTVTPHAVTAGSCAGTNASCHPSIDLWALHAKSQSGGAPKYASCGNTGCHNPGNIDKRPTLKTCGTGNSCHADKDLATHGSKDHTFTAASDYSAATEAGCTNSGGGCHGAETNGYLDMAIPYHPGSGCTSGVCHQSASKPAYPGSNECVSCHDSNYTGAPDRVALTTSHYNETTHTAGSQTATVAAGGTATATCANCHNGVSAGIDGLSAQHQGLAASQVTSATYTNVACGECHNYSLAVTTIITTSWPTKTCSACHNVDVLPLAVQHGTTAPAVNSSSTNSCGASGINCHTTYDVHALHKNAAGGCALTGCHDYNKQGLNPTIQACGQAGGCHAAYTLNTHLHAADAAKHQPTTTTQASDTFLANQCGSCHDIRTSNSSLTLEHNLATSAKTTVPTNVCQNCHNNAAATTAIAGNWATKDTTSACSTCHGIGTLPARHVTANSGAHSDVTSAGCGNSGIGCHNSNDLSQVGGTTSINTNIHSTCLRCHDRTAVATTWTSAMLTTPANIKWNPALDTCGSTECHTSTYYNPAVGATQYQHRIGQADVVTGIDSVHHVDSTMTATITQGVATATCATCHSGALATAHATSLTGWASTCTGCHNSTISGNVAPTQVKLGWATDDCGDCHIAGASAVKIPNMHSGYGTASHAGTSTVGCGASGAGCHNTYDLAVLHGATKTNGCQLSGCHDAVNKAMGSATKSCGTGGGCHSGYSSTAGHRANTITGDESTHTATAMTTKIDTATYTYGNACSNCHSSGLKSAHTTVTAVLDSGRAAWTTPYCTNCHNSTFPEANSVTTIKTNSWSAQTCDQCHVTNGNGKHTTYTLGTHTSLVGTAGTADGCVSGACHLAGATSDVRLIHDRASSGCSASGQDSLNGNGGVNSACHALNKPMVVGTIGCGSGTTGATKCHVNHTNTNHGISTGGKACYTCHAVYKDSMNTTGTARAATVHHVMGTATQSGDIAPNAGTYPNTKTDVFCVSCHTDHNYFNGAASKAGNLRTTAVTASGATTAATDFIAGGTGVCVSCHDVSLTKEGMGTQQLNVGTATTPIIAGADFNGSAHQYSVPSSFGPSATFNANCSKCHSDEQTKQYATGTYKFGTHFSASAGILRVLGAYTANPPKEEACFKCHITAAGSGTDLKTVALKDAYGTRTMSAVSETTTAEFALASKHNLTKVACANCHNVHEATAAAPVADPDNTYTTASITTTATVNTFCLKCHDGTLPVQTVNGTTLIPYTVSANATANVTTNYAVSGHGSLGAASVDCRDCHEQHGSSLVHLLKTSVDGQAVASYTDTADQRQCLACHRTGGIAATANIARYYPTTVGGAATQSGSFPTGTRFGHRTKTAGSLPANSSMPCRSCHNPHGGSGSGYMLAVRTQLASGVDTMVGDAAGELTMTDASQTPANAVNTRNFCFTCHTTSDTTNGWNGTAMAVVPAGAKVLGIERASGSVLKLPTLANGVNGHKAADTHSCYLCHGDDFSAGNSVNVHNPSAGESRGGIPCYTCHTVYQDKMEDGLGLALGLTRAVNYHHVLGSAARSGDSTVSPTLTGDTRQNVYCLSCHVDHDKFSKLVNSGFSRSANLRAAFSDAAVTTASSDWLPAGGVCIGCHSVELTRDNTDQKPETNSTRTTSLNSGQYDLSAHQYAATSTFTDASTFNADCVKCHDSEIDGGGMERGSGIQGFQTSANKFSTHSSSARRLLGSMGITVVDPPAEEVVCYKCHSTSGEGLKVTANRDYYNATAMNATSQAIRALSNGSTYRHNVGAYSGLHRPSPTDETNAYLSANKHVECADCHGVHGSTPTRHVPGGTTSLDTNANNVSGALTGATGVTPTFATTNWTAPTAYPAPAPATKEYQICFKCHSGANTSVTTWGGAGALSWTDQGLEFSTTNQSYHPVVAGLPATDPGVNGSSRLQTADMRTGNTNGTTAFQIGDTMYCSDCHAQNSAGSLGPHGSSVKWMLKGPNQAWPYTTAAGNGGTTGTFFTYLTRDTGIDTSNGLFCRNCHVLNGIEHTRGGDHDNVSCTSCHIRVPHGGKVSRLLRAGTNAQVPDRYEGNGNGTGPAAILTGFVKDNAGAYVVNDCAQTGCGQHGATTTGQENW